MGKHSIPGDTPGSNDVNFGAGAPWNDSVSGGNVSFEPPEGNWGDYGAKD